MRRLIAYGLRVRSEIDIPGALPDRDASAGTDLTVTLIEFSSGQSDQIYRFEGEDLCFTAPGVAEYRCRPDQVKVVPDPSASADDIGEFLVATALPIVLWMRDQFVLHAAAASLPKDNLAIAIAGVSGIGKSTVLAQLLAAGASIVGDDTLRVEKRQETSGVYRISGLGGGYFLTEDGNTPRAFRTAPANRLLRSAPLGAILILSRGGAGESASLQRVRPVRGVEHLLANRHRPRVPALLGQHAQTLADSALLANTIPIYEWRRPAGLMELTAWERAALARCTKEPGASND